MRVLAVALVLHALYLLDPVPLGEGPCREGDFALPGFTVICYSGGDDLRAYLHSAAGQDFDYDYMSLCTNQSNVTGCDSPRDCLNSQGVPGTLWSVLRRPKGTPNAVFEHFTHVCLTAGEEDDFEVISWRRVWAVMKTLEWPQAELVVQPVGGRTLINFETNFFTTTTRARVLSVRLGGREVEIEATPESYTWHWGDGSAAESTTEPGAEHVDGEPHEVFRVYTDAGVTVRPSVDVTYRGRYRIEGGLWFPIPETLTVEGDPVALEVVSARVQLVG